MRTRTLFPTLVVAVLSVMAEAQAAPVGFVKLTATPITATTFTDAACADQTTCYYYVTAVDTTGHESSGAPCAATQLCFGGNQGVAQMPSSGTHTVVLTWTAPTTAVAGYNVYRLIPGQPGNLTTTVN